MKLTLFLCILCTPLIIVLFIITLSGTLNKSEAGTSKSWIEWRGVINERVRHARKFCKSYKRRWAGMPELFWDELNGVAFCANAKAGTTKWLRLLLKSRNLNETENVHKAASLYLKRSSKPISYLFLTCVRHPFTRLVSAYAEKIPANYNNISDTIIRTYRDPRFSDSWLRQYLVPAIDLQINPTFSEFVKYVIDDLSNCTDQMSHCLYSKDVHWRPQAERCNPCTTTFNFIAKIETLRDDIEYLKKVMWMRNERILDIEDIDKFYHRNNYISKRSETSLISSLSSDIKKKLYNIYENDFLAFDYSPDVY